MTIFFGESWCNLTEHGQQIPTPIDSECSWCNEGFVEDEQGIGIPSIDDEQNAIFAFYHKNCFLRTIFGSVGHQRMQCSCYGGTLEDPQELPLREAANAAVREYSKLEVS